MDHSALSRTRRNLIGVSVVLALISAFGWEFPSQIRILGNDLQANANAIRFLVLMAFVYLIYEYRVHAKPVFKKFADSWREAFAELHKNSILEEMRNAYSVDDRVRILYKKTRKGGWKNTDVTSVELKSLKSKHVTLEMTLILTITGDTDSDPKGSVETERKGRYSLNYLKSPWAGAKAFLVLALGDSEYFEYVLPLFFPLLAIVCYMLGPFGILDPQHAVSAAHFGIGRG